MASKKQRRLERAAQLRRELGLEGDDDDVRRTVVNDAGASEIRRTDDVPASGGGRDPVQPDTDANTKPTSRRERRTSVAEQAAATQLAVDRSIDPKHHPKKHAPGSLKRGDTVWYRGDRFWVEWVPKSWDKGCFARICDRPVLSNPDLPTPVQMAMTEYGLKPENMKHAKVLTFCVHPDLLSLAPPPISTFAHPPTQAQHDRKERAAKGQKDVGDPVAVQLREAKNLDEVYRIGAQFLEMQVEDLKKRYQHLNPGQQRMNVGNKMRAKWRKDQKS